MTTVGQLPLLTDGGTTRLLPPQALSVGARQPRRRPVTADTDTGCRAAPSCLRCPFAVCIYEDPRGPRTALHADRDGEIWRQHHAGWTARALARHHGLSRRQIFRILARVRAERAEPARQLPLPLHEG